MQSNEYMIEFKKKTTNKKLPYMCISCQCVYLYMYTHAHLSKCTSTEKKAGGQKVMELG